MSSTTPSALSALVAGELARESVNFALLQSSMIAAVDEYFCLANINSESAKPTPLSLSQPLPLLQLR